MIEEPKKDTFEQASILTLVEGVKESYEMDSDKSLPEGVVIHRTSEGDVHHFDLVKKIGRFTYQMSLGEGRNGKYECLFWTREYAYASVKLTPDEQKQLWSALSGFIKIAASHPEAFLKEIGFNPSKAAESAEDIDTCIEKILAHPKNTSSKQELLDLAASFDHDPLFKLYADLYDERFHTTSYASESSVRAEARFRIFRTFVKKYLPEWEIEQVLDDDFRLKPRA